MGHRKYTDAEKAAMTPEEKRALGWFTGQDDPRKASGGPRKTKEGKTVTSMARAHTEEALTFLVDTMRDEKVNRKLRAECAVHLLSRGWGNPKDSITIDAQVNHDHVARIDPALLSFEARQQILSAMTAAQNQPAITVEPILIEADSKGSDE